MVCFDRGNRGSNESRLNVLIMFTGFQVQGSSSAGQQCSVGPIYFNQSPFSETRNKQKHQAAHCDSDSCIAETTPTARSRGGKSRYNLRPSPLTPLLCLRPEAEQRFQCVPRDWGRDWGVRGSVTWQHGSETDMGKRVGSTGGG